MYTCKCNCGCKEKVMAEGTTCLMCLDGIHAPKRKGYKKIVAKWTPLSWEAFNDYRLNSLTLSALDIELLQLILPTYISGYGDVTEKTMKIVEKARSFGWLEKNDKGALKKIGERIEFEAKAARLGYDIPWAAAA